MEPRTSFHSYYEEDRDIKYLNVPVADDMSEEGDEYNKQRRASSNFFNRIVGFAVTFCAVSAFIVLLILHFSKGGTHDGISTDDITLQGCYEAPACTHIDAKYELATGFTNLTGWKRDRSLLGAEACCDICSTPTAQRSRPLSAVDYNYLLLDQIWLPQFCNAFIESHDPTLSHLYGSLCLGSVSSSTPRLTIHGLWPSLAQGSSTCCTSPTGQSYSPLDPSEVDQWPIWPDLQDAWFDPSVSCSYGNMQCSVCYLLNHEWQKHGTCFASFYTPDSAEGLESTYFSTGLTLASMLSEASQFINGMNGTLQSVTSVSSLYDKAVNVMCDPKATYIDNNNGNTGVFLEVQTCWNITSLPSSHAPPAVQNLTMIDCPPAFENDFTQLCPDTVYIPNFMK